MRTVTSATIDCEPFGVSPDGPVDRYHLINGGLRVAILTYGGVLQSIETPDRQGRSANVTLGFASLADYVERSPYLGNITGRYANRIAGGRFSLDDRVYQLSLNDGPHSLHGGSVGFGDRVWAAESFSYDDRVGLRLTFLSPDGDQGYPGTLEAAVTYTLSPDSALHIEYEASTDEVTVVNLTNHALFNLAGEGSGSIEGHQLHLDADRYTPVDATLIPTGDLDPVAGTPLDFTRPTAIGERIRDSFAQLAIAHGYDHNYVLNHPGDMGLAARVVEPLGGRTLEVHTTEPGIQLYSGNFLDGTLTGTGGAPYGRGDGFALETQHFPDSPNHPGFPTTVLRPGQTFRSTTVYRFGVLPDPA